MPAAPVLVLAAAVAGQAYLAIPPTVTPNDVFPRPGDLPANGRLVVFRPAPLDVGFVRTTPDGAQHTLATHPFGDALVVDLGAMTPGDDVAVTPECGRCEALHWSVVAADDAAPVFDETVADNAATDGGASGVFHATAVVAADDASGVFFDVLVDGGAPLVDQVERTGALAFDIPDDPSAHICADVVAIDAAGNAAQRPDPICVDTPPQPPHGPIYAGCSASSSSAPSSATTPLVVTAAFVLALRPRRRG